MLEQSEIDKETIREELVRDFTSFGNFSILAILTVVVVGLNKNSLYILIFLLLTEFIGSTIKILFFKDRPRKKEYKNLYEKLNAASFPSLHASRVTFTFTALYYFSSINSRAVFLLLIPIVATTRLILKKHDVVDIFSGAILGLCVFVGLIFFYGSTLLK